MSQSRAAVTLLVLALVAAAVTGGLVFLLWTPLGLPPHGGPHDAPFPGLWQWFFTLWLPAMFPAFTAFHLSLLRASRGDEAAATVARQAARWDWWSYLLLPAFLLLMGAAGQVGRWRLPLAVFFVAVLFAKVLLVVRTLYRGFVLLDPGAGALAPRRLGRYLFLVALGLYGFLIPYVVTAVSTAGDEHVYLLNTHSLYADADLEIGNNVARRDWQRFYWGRPSPESWTAQFLGFPLLLLPGYALGTALLPGYPLGGRLGAALTIGLASALLGVQAYRLCREVGASSPAAFWAWAVVALTPPVLVNSSHIYPELPAACAAVVGVRALRRLPARAWPRLLVAAAAAAVLVFLKDRYTPIAVGLLLWALARQARQSPRLAGALLAGLLAAGVLLMWLNPLPLVFRNLGSASQLAAVLLDWNWHMLRALLGLWADQEFGLLYYAPHWTLALVGLPLLWRRDRETALGLAGLVLFYLAILVKYRWLQWDAGWTPPPRFILVAAPLLAPSVASVFDRCRGRVLAACNTLWWAWSATVACSLVLVPFWRYNNLDGRSTLVQLAGVQLGLDLARFLPSLRAPGAWTWFLLGAGSVLVVAAAAYGARSPGSEALGWGERAVWLRAGQAGALLLAVAVGWLAAAVVVPTRVVEAEAMRHDGGLQFGAYQNQAILWVMTREGSIWERCVTWPGETEITITAGGYTTTGVAPRMTLLLDGRPVATWELRAGAGRWVEDQYVTRVRTGFGRPVLRLQFAKLLDHRRAGRVQHAYVDRIRLRWLGDRSR